MKQIVSVSLGSSLRDHVVEIELLGEHYRIERIGTDGDIDKMIELIKELDGKVDAFGLGGIGLYFHAGEKRFTLRDAKRIVETAKITPIVDGLGLKDIIESNTVKYLENNTNILSNNPSVLMTSGVDRFGLAQALDNAGCKMTFGDLIFTVGIPFPIRSLKSLIIVASILVPPLSQLPFSLIYPTGKKQEENKPKATKLFNKADIIAGDYLFISRYMPSDMKNKIIITNTTTASDVEILKERGIKTLVTTTPVLEGRSFGVNVIEALFVALSNKGRELTQLEYEELLESVNFEPRILQLSNL